MNKLQYLLKDDEIGQKMLEEAIFAYNHLEASTVKEIRVVLLKVAQNIAELYILGENNDMNRNEIADSVAELFPTMSKQDRSKMVVYYNNYNEISKYFDNINSISISVDYMVRAWQKHVRESQPEIKNAELAYLVKNKSDVKKDKAKSKRAETSSITSPVTAQDHLLNLGRVLANVIKFGKSNAYTNDEIDKTIEGLMTFASEFETCKTQLAVAVNQ